MGDPIITGEEGRDLINRFNPATYVCLSQTNSITLILKPIKNLKKIRPCHMTLEIQVS
jgi:hypothetical protein